MIFRPSYFDDLSKPTIYEDMKSLIPIGLLNTMNTVAGESLSLMINMLERTHLQRVSRMLAKLFVMLKAAD